MDVLISVAKCYSLVIGCYESISNNQYKQTQPNGLIWGSPPPHSNRLFAPNPKPRAFRNLVEWGPPHRLLLVSSNNLIKLPSSLRPTLSPSSSNFVFARNGACCPKFRSGNFWSPSCGFYLQLGLSNPETASVPSSAQKPESQCFRLQ